MQCIYLRQCCRKIEFPMPSRHPKTPTTWPKWSSRCPQNAPKTPRHASTTPPRHPKMHPWTRPKRHKRAKYSKTPQDDFKPAPEPSRPRVRCLRAWRLELLLVICLTYFSTALGSFSSMFCAFCLAMRGGGIAGITTYAAKYK